MTSTPVTPAAGSELGEALGVVLLLAVLLLPLAVFGVRARVTGGGRGGRSGCLGFLLKLAVLWIGASVLAYPAGVLLTLGTPELAEHPAIWAVAAASPLVAVGFARWFGPRDGAPGLLVRTVLLLLACAAAVLAADAAGLPLDSRAGLASMVSLTAAVVCIAAWRLAYRLRPWQLPVAAVAASAAGAGVAAWAQANGLPVLTDPGGAGMITMTALLVVMGLQVFAASLLLSAGWRWIDRLWHGPRVAVDGTPVEPGQIWNARVPFEQDETGSKERPVLVLRTLAGHAEIAPITSQDKSRYPRYVHLPLDAWRRVLSRESWLELKAVELPYRHFRNPRGSCLPEVWKQVQALDLSPGAGPARPAEQGAPASPRQRGPRVGGS